MLKKLFGVILFASPLSCFAWGSGFYFGAAIGADSTDFKVYSTPSSPGSFSVINKTELAAQGVLGDFFAGYSWYKNWFYLGTEINGSINSSKFTTSNQEIIHNAYSQTTYQINPTWGVGILPGIMLPQDAILYGRVGYADGKFKINTSDNSLANATTWLNGLRLGVGLEKKIYKQFGVRAEYSHISYQNQMETVFEPVGNVTKATTVTPNTNLFELAFDYRFD